MLITAPPARRRGLALTLASALLVVVALVAAARPLCAAALPGPALPPSPIAVPGPALDVMPLSAIQRGQKGYGISVFAGTTLERFEVEVLGVIHDQQPNVSYVLARLSGRGLEASGVIAGMSGSPVYIDGKLVGAVAFSWPFAKEAIAGITPIEAMRELRGGAAPPLSVPTAAMRDLRELLPKKAVAGAREALAADLTKLRPVLAGQPGGAVTWSVSGFAAPTQELLGIGLGAVAPSGQASTGSLPSELRPGDAVAAVLVDGDLRLAATGTVTDRVDQDVLAFGHPFLGLGAVDIPMAGAEVVAVVSNQYSSFKIANFGPIVGSFRQDRLAGIMGRVGASPTTLPLDVHIESSRSADYHLRLARVPQLTPTLLAISVLGAQEAAAQTTGSLGLDLDATFDLGPMGTVRVVQSFDGDSAATDAAINLLQFGNFFLNNAFAQVELRGVEIRLAQHPAPRTAVLVGGYADRTEVHPGDSVQLHLDLVPWRGEAVRRDLMLRLPGDLPAGRYSVLVGDGVSIDSARMGIEPASPQRLDQALRTVRSFHSRRDLVAIGIYSADGLAVAGEVLPRLPGSLRAVWSAASSPSAVALPLALAQERSERSDYPVDGSVRIELNVVRRAPLTSGSAAATAAPAPPAPSPTGGSRDEGKSGR